MPLTPFKVTAEANRSTVEIDGKDVSAGCTRVTVDCNVHDIPKIFVEMIGEGTIEGEGIVHVVKGDGRQAVLEFLDNLDPAHLERVALEQFNDPTFTTGQAFKAALKEIAGVNRNGT